MTIETPLEKFDPMSVNLILGSCAANNCLNRPMYGFWDGQAIQFVCEGHYDEILDCSEAATEAAEEDGR